MADKQKGKGDREPVSRREAWQLVGAAYRESFPYLLLVLGILFIVLWLLTEVVFVP